MRTDKGSKHHNKTTHATTKECYLTMSNQVWSVEWCEISFSLNSQDKCVKELNWLSGVYCPKFAPTTHGERDCMGQVDK